MLEPETEAAARDAYDGIVPAAREVLRESTRAMGFDRDEYDERVTPGVVETARDALFASLLVVHRGSRAEFEAWCEEHPDLERVEAGSSDVANVAWHPAPAVGVVAAATYQNEPDAAASAVRRQAFGRFYRDLL